MLICCKRQKTPEYITDDREISSDASDRGNFDNKSYSKENSNEEDEEKF